LPTWISRLLLSREWTLPERRNFDICDLKIDTQ
jgi:hypothetical protein